MRSRIILITLLAIMVSLYASGCSAATPAPAAEPTSLSSPVASPDEVTAEGRLEPVKYVEVAVSASGTISQLFAAQGEQVEAGQVIVQLQTQPAPKTAEPKCPLVPKISGRLWNFRRPFLTYAPQCPATQAATSSIQTGQTLAAAQSGAALRLANAHQAVHEAQDKLDNFAIPAKFTGMTAAQAARVALQDLDTARATFAPYKDNSVQGYRANHSYPSLPGHVYVDTEYYKGGLAKEYDKRVNSGWVDYRRAVMWLEMESALETAQAQLAQAQKDVDSLQDASLAEDTAGARAALASAELRAPFDGTITNMDLKAGQVVTAGSNAATIADFSSWVVKTTDLTEIDVVNIKEGQPVTLTLDAIPGVTFNGTVLSIGQNYSEKQGDIVYEVKVLLADKNPAMRWGMTAKLHFPK